MPEFPNPDDVTGALARALQVLRPRVRNTLAQLGVYEGVGLGTLFPLRSACPK